MRRALLAFWPAPVVAGLLHWLAFPPVDQGWLAIPAWALLLLSMRLRRGERAGRQAFVFGCVLFVPGFAWIAPLVVGGWLFTAAWCACFEALYAWLVARLWLRRERRGWVLGAALLHLLIDMLRTIALSGFPWLLTGYTGWNNPVLIGSAHVLGVHGATLAIVLLGAGLAEAAARCIDGERAIWRPVLPAILVWATLSASLALGVSKGLPGPRVALLQGRIPQLLKEDRVATGAEITSIDDWWRRHEELAAEAGSEGAGAIDVVIWPETMVPDWAFHDLRTRPESPDLWRRLARISDGAHTLAGIQTVDAYGRLYNSVVSIDAAGQAIDLQDKQHLTPGGEYIPFIRYVPFRAWLERVLEEKAGFLPDLEPGDGVHLLAVPHRGEDERESQVGVLICYESIFPSISRDMVRQGADFLLNASNYGWFEGTALMDQTLAMASFRASETRTPLVMSSNNGVSAVIGPDGAVESILTDPEGRTADFHGVLVARVPHGSGRSLFLFWGEWPAWLLGVLGLAIGLAGARRDSGRDPSSS